MLVSLARLVNTSSCRGAESGLSRLPHPSLQTHSVPANTPPGSPAAPTPPPPPADEETDRSQNSFKMQRTISPLPWDR